MSRLNDYLVSIKPREIIMNSDMKSYYDMLPSVVSQYIPMGQVYGEEYFNYDLSLDLIKQQLQTDNIKKCSFNNHQYAIISAGAVLKYINDTQKRFLVHINNIEFENLNIEYKEFIDYKLLGEKKVHKLNERISPKKTIEGTVIGTLLATIFGFFVMTYLVNGGSYDSWYLSLLLSFMLSILSIVIPTSCFVSSKVLP